MVYGRSLADHGLLAFNDGVAATGSTSPLWAAFVALAHVVGGGDTDRTVIGVYVIGAVLHLVSLVLVTRLAQALSGSATAAVAAGLLVAVSGPLAMGALSGMEVSLTSTLVLAALLATVRRAWLWAGTWLALGAIARPEVAVVSLACFAFALWETRAEPIRARVRPLASLAMPSIVIGAASIAYALWATGRPLPATFYMKQEGSLGELPMRLGIALRGLVGDVPPFRTGFAALAAAGLVFPGMIRPRGSRATLIVVTASALGFLLANIVLIRPHANVFYHLRYLLPAVPVLVTLLVAGACELGRLAPLVRSPRAARMPLAIVFAIGMLEGVLTLRGDSTRMHNDTRNIEEIQRALGRWINEHTAPSTWVATGDAGAVRYFGKRPTIDVMGLNTPELYWTPGWGAGHPVAAFVMIPCWFQPTDQRVLRVAARARTEHYTVADLDCMREQVVTTCVGPTDVPLAFGGVRSFRLMCRPGLLVPRSK
jgi:hypothetical protein